MRKVFFFYFHKDKYYSSSPIVNNFKILQKWREDFFKQGIEMTNMLEYLPQYKDKNLKEELQYSITKEQVSDELMEAMKNIVNDLPNISLKYDKILFLGFHPMAFQPFIRYNKELKKYSNIRTILWQDDLHAFFKTDESKKKLEYADHIITPSPVYFENLFPEYLSKTSFFFYSANFEENEKFSWEWDRRFDKIILTGCVNKGYIIRAKIASEMVKNNKFGEITEFLKKPNLKEYNYKDDVVLPYGINYYKILGKFKGAFFGYYEYPKNFNLAKIIEILSMGCIGFFEYSPLMEKELGLIAMEHYVPCTDKENGKLITDVEYYKYYLENKDGKGKIIAENGREYVRKHFSNQKGFENYVRILNNI
jgi:hypothetical protein